MSCYDYDLTISYADNLAAVLADSRLDDWLADAQREASAHGDREGARLARLACAGDDEARRLWVSYIADAAMIRAED